MKDKTNVIVRLNQETKDQLQIIADKDSRSVNNLIAWLIAEHLKKEGKK